MSDTIIIQAMPSWARIPTATALTGVPDNTIRALVNKNLVRARKTSPGVASALVVKIGDIEEWLETDAPKPAKFKVSVPLDAQPQQQESAG